MAPQVARYETGTAYDKNTWKATTLFEAQRVLYSVGHTLEPLSRLGLHKRFYSSKKNAPFNFSING